MEELTPVDKKVVDLLSKLKNTNGNYPAEIFSVRRETYLRQVANVSLGIGIGMGLKNVTNSGNGAIGVATITSKILETVLIAAIAIEAGTATYLYRGKITDFIKRYISHTSVQEVAPSTNNNSSNNSGVSEVTATPRATATEIPTYTLVPPLFINNNGSSTNNNNGSSVNTNPSVSDTPKPGGNNGNHYGQTPKPERTKMNNNGGNSNNGGNGNNNGGGNNGNGNSNKNKP